MLASQYTMAPQGSQDQYQPPLGVDHLQASGSSFESTNTYMNPGPQYTGGQFFMPPPHFQNLPSFQNPLSFPSHPYSIQQPIVPAEQLSSSGPIRHSTSQERNPQLYPYPHYAEPGLSARYATGGRLSSLGSLERIP